MSPKEQEIVLMLAIIYSRYHHFLQKKKKHIQIRISYCVVSVSVSTVIHQFASIAYCIYTDFLLSEKKKEGEHENKRKKRERA